jgi:PAS domain S-box-containing protein
MSIRSREAVGTDRQCWEFLECRKVLCPAHGKSHVPCWLVPKTHCSSHVFDDFLQRLAECLICPFFKTMGEAHPGGWNHFVADQVRRHNFQALEQIYLKEESFVEILNRIPDGLFTTDREWRITYFNPAAEKITGFSSYDAVGMYCKDVFKNTICESDCALKRAVADGKDIQNREYVIRDIDGRAIPIMCSTSVFRDAEGRISGGIEIFKDITELKRLHEEIARREKKYRRIFEGSHDMIYTTNLRGTILDVNKAGVDMLGYASREEMLWVGSARRLYRRPRDRDRFLKLMNKEGYVKDFGVDFKKKDKSPIHVLISSRRYEDPETGEVQFEGIIKDITQRKLAEETLKQRNRELSILNAIAVALNLTMDLDHILKVTLGHVLKVLRLRRGALFLIDTESKKTVLRVTHGLPPLEQPESEGVFFKDPVLKRDLIERNVEFPATPSFPPFRVTYLPPEGKSVPWLTSFLITSKGRGAGFLGLDIPSPRELSPHELHLMGSVCNFLGGAIENTQLVETIRQHRQVLRRLTERLFQSQEEERRRIARELHDEAGQALTAVKLCLDRLEKVVPSENVVLGAGIEEMRNMLTRTSSEIRSLSYRLHPTLLSDLGLEPALDLYVKEVARHARLDIGFRMVGFDRRLDPDTETVLYRFSQEALTNTLKHSAAGRFRLSIIKSYPKIIFLAEDDGKGFDGQIGGNATGSLGLLGMRERATLLGGTFMLKSRPGEGTRIRIEIPVQEASVHGALHQDIARG